MLNRQAFELLIAGAEIAYPVPTRQYVWQDLYDLCRALKAHGFIFPCWPVLLDSGSSHYRLLAKKTTVATKELS